MRPIIGRRKEDGDDRESKAVVGFRAAYVLDVAQTDGEALPERRRKPPSLPAPRPPD